MLTTFGTIQSRVSYSSGQLCTIACVNVRFRVQRRVVELANKRPTLGLSGTSAKKQGYLELIWSTKGPSVKA
jgi:hypothetical protein